MLSQLVCVCNENKSKIQKQRVEHLEFMNGWEGLVARLNLKPQEACRHNTAIHSRTRSITNCHHPDELTKAHLIQQRLEEHTVHVFPWSTPEGQGYLKAHVTGCRFFKG